MATVQTGIATDLITFSRTSNATLTDSDGLIKWAPHNLLLASEQFDSASWTKTSTTPSANAVAAPNGTTTADTLTASGANGTTLQSYTSLGVSYTFGIWLKRKTGTGNIQIAADSGTYTTVTITSDWALYTVTQTPAAGTISAGIRIVTSADAVEAWGAHLYRSDLGGMKANTSAYPMYNPTTPKNLLGYTQSFDDAYWLKYSVAVPATKYADPYGGTTANLLYPTAAVPAPGLYKGGFPSVSKTHSYFVKAAGKTWFCVLKETTGAGAAWFNLSTGLVGTVAAGYTAPNPESLGNGWYRCSVTSTSGFDQYTAVTPVDADNSITPTPNGTDGVYIWGAQLSDSASLDTYVPNYGAAPTAAAYYGPRLDADPVTLSQRGLLVEEQRANIALNSADFTNVSWTKGNAGSVDPAVTADQSTAPDGTVTADKVDFGAIDAAGDYSVVASVFTAEASAYAGSVYVKAVASGDVGKKIWAYYYDTAIRGVASVTLTTSWQRLVSVGTLTAGTSRSLNIGTIGSTSGGENQGAVSVYMWGGQNEKGSFATSYIPTGAATATRNADVASVSTQAFPYSSTEGTLVVNASVLATVSGSRSMVTLISANDTQQSSVLGNNNGGGGVTEADFYVRNVSDQAWLRFSTAISAGTPIKLAGAYKNNDFGGSANGTTAISDPLGVVPNSSDTLLIGRMASATGVLNGHIRQITYLPRRISNTELQTRTS